MFELYIRTLIHNRLTDNLKSNWNKSYGTFHFLLLVGSSQVKSEGVMCSHKLSRFRIFDYIDISRTLLLAREKKVKSEQQLVCGQRAVLTDNVYISDRIFPSCLIIILCTCCCQRQEVV